MAEEIKLVKNTADGKRKIPYCSVIAEGNDMFRLIVTVKSQLNDLKIS
jgi:hypothetical protein